MAQPSTVNPAIWRGVSSLAAIATRLRCGSKHTIASALPAVLLASVIAVGHAAAQSPAGAFAGKTVNLIIGFGTGGGYDLWARVVGRHIGRHLPGNPTVTPQNMEGAGSYRAANFSYNVAPKDGTSIALISRDAPLGPLIGTPGARFDATKLSWLGTPAIETNVCIAYNTAPVACSLGDRLPT